MLPKTQEGQKKPHIYTFIKRRKKIEEIKKEVIFLLGMT